MAETLKKWEEISRSYRVYIKLEKRLSENTVESYMRDLRQFAHFILRFYDVPPRKVEAPMIERYLALLYDQGREKTSQARALSGIRSFYNYLMLTDVIDSTPTQFIDTPKFGRHLPDILTVEEIDRIVAAVDTSTVKGRRDSAMLEVLYSCGLRVSELTSLRLGDLFFGEGYIRVTGKGDKQRLVPVSGAAREKIQRYLDDRATKNVRIGRRVPQQPGDAAYPCDGLHDPARSRSPAGIDKHISPHTSVIRCYASARRGRFDPSGAGDAGAREHPDHRNLHPSRGRSPARYGRKVPAAVIDGNSNDKGRRNSVPCRYCLFSGVAPFPGLDSERFADGNRGLHSPDQRIRAMHDAGVSVIES